MSNLASIDAIFNEPFPSRKAFVALRRRLEEQLSSGEFSAGDPFPSDADLVRTTGLSRDTVRKALGELSRDGWIERRHGLGTFVGPRVSLPISRRIGEGVERTRVMGRVAVLGSWFWRDGIDWYTAGIMESMEHAAEQAGVSIEFLGNRGVNRQAVCRRLVQTHPDVLICLLPRTQHALIIAEAQRLEIPTFITGTRLADIGVPTIREDGAQGGRLAVERLVKAGHRRIGLLAWTEGGSWIFERRRGYLNGLRDAGIELDERLTLWLDRGSESNTPAENEAIAAATADQIYNYVQSQRPTALVITAAGITADLALLVRGGQLRVPDDLSLVQFDQAFDVANRDIESPTCIALPIREMGQRLIEVARRAINQEAIGPLDPILCTLIEGSSVKQLS
jgi:DNA-binding LacI/PurR family transcriptional regulator